MIKIESNDCNLYSRQMLCLKTRVRSPSSDVDNAYWLLLEATQSHGHPDNLTSLHEEDVRGVHLKKKVT